MKGLVSRLLLRILVRQALLELRLDANSTSILALFFPSLCLSGMYKILALIDIFYSKQSAEPFLVALLHLKQSDRVELASMLDADKLLKFGLPILSAKVFTKRRTPKMNDDIMTIETGELTRPVPKPGPQTGRAVCQDTILLISRTLLFFWCFGLEIKAWRSSLYLYSLPFLPSLLDLSAGLREGLWSSQMFRTCK